MSEQQITGTYRLQLTPAAGFEAASGLAAYLADLGVSHVYLSPVLQAVPGSQHGYDVLDHTRISEDLGGEAAFRAMAHTFRSHGLGIVVDIVPNHMAFPNPLADDVIENGRASRHYDWFDIDGERPVLPGEGTPNYRRFFDISGLIALRQEVPEVFEHTHGLILRLVSEGLVDGLRVDHPDGLTDPRGYVRTLAARAPSAWIVVEKILAGDERLPGDWPCAGTTGYDALRRVGGVFLDGAGSAPLSEAYVRFTRNDEPYAEIVDTAKREILAGSLKPEFDRLLRVLRDSGGPHEGDLRADLTDLLVATDRYRTYAAPAGEFLTRFQQTSAPLAAKGVEDTAFYRWSRFTALNEVGGEPDHLGLPPADFHAWCAEQPVASMTTLSTHDTKRGEDVRARLAVLAEMPEAWERAVLSWRRLLPASPLEPDLEYLLWQTLCGAWPLSLERLNGYLTKSMREAKTRTNWVTPDKDYEADVLGHVAGLLGTPAVTEALGAFVDSLRPFGRANSLGQKLVQLTMPGVPDVYQGCELAEEGPGLALVDPDNRRPVDYDHRRRLLASLRGSEPRVLDEEKLLVTSRALRLRRSHPEWFAGSYEAVAASGPAAAHALAFRRTGAITVATRLPYGLSAAGGWRDTELTLPAGSFVDVLTSREVSGSVALSSLLSSLPVALLVQA